MARIALNSGATVVRPTQYNLVANLDALNTMTAELMNTRTVTWGTAMPAAGARLQGDIHYHTAPTNGGHIGWVCITTGTPGVWRTFGVIAAA